MRAYCDENPKPMSFGPREWHLALEKPLKDLPPGTWAFSDGGRVLRVLGKDGVMRTYKAPSSHLVSQEHANEIKKLGGKA